LSPPPPSPLSPLYPISPPLASPPVTTNYIVESKFVVEGTLDDISEYISQIKAKFASYLGVEESQITINVEPASVLLTVSISMPSETTAQAVNDELIPVFTDAATLGEFIGSDVEVTKIIEYPTVIVSDYTLSISLQSGWNLISINVIDTDLSLNAVFDSANNLDMIKNQTVLSTYYQNIGWFGSFEAIDPTSGYYYKSSNEFTVDIYGNSASKIPLDLQSGWNLISYMLPTTEPVSKVFPPNLFANGDLLKDDQAFTTLFSASGQQFWFGTLNELVPGKGYYFKSKNKTMILMDVVGDSIVIAPSSQVTSINLPPSASPPSASPPSASPPTEKVLEAEESESEMSGGTIVMLVFVLLLVVALTIVITFMCFHGRFTRRSRTDPVSGQGSEGDQIQVEIQLQRLRNLRQVQEIQRNVERR